LLAPIVSEKATNVAEKSPVPSVSPTTGRLVARFFFLAIAMFLGALFGCGRDYVPPLVEVRHITPREIEVADRIEIDGAGFPEGRVAHVTFRGTRFRAGELPDASFRVVTEGVVTRENRIEVTVNDALESAFCGVGENAQHASFEGEVEVGFASDLKGAPPLVGRLTGVTLDVVPSSIRASVFEARVSQGQRLLAFLGVVPGAVSAHGMPIVRIEAGGVGERVGLREGDALVGVDGLRLRDASDLVPASGRSMRVRVRRSGQEETLTVPLIGYASDRIPVEYGPAFILVGVALAFLLLLVLPFPAVVASLEVRLARSLRSFHAKDAFASLFGRGRVTIVSALATFLVVLFALGSQAAWAAWGDFDAAIATLTALALFVAARMVSRVRGALPAAAGTFGLGVLLSLCVLVELAHRGAVRLPELVRAQGYLPWHFSLVRSPVDALLAFAYSGTLFVLVRPRKEVRLLHDAHEPPAVEVRAKARRAQTNASILERVGLVFASAVGVALFLGGWQVPGGTEGRSALVVVLMGLLFGAKTTVAWAALHGAVSVAMPWTTVSARAFVLRRIVPALALALILVVLARYVPQSDSLSGALGVTVVFAFALLAVRFALRIRGAMIRPEPHASPFL
jgi:hypothetical protein